MRAVAAAMLFVAALCGGCRGRGTPYVFELPPGFPPPRVPPESPVTVEKAELGRHLFHDRRLSANGRQSCADCHQQARGFSEGRARAVGSTGEAHRRNAPALVNVGYLRTLGWADPGLTSLEQQIRIPLFGKEPLELGAAGHEEEILGRLRAGGAYRRLFESAFADQAQPFAFDNVVAAIAAFVRTLVSADSPYDRYQIRREATALSAAEQRGRELFFSGRLRCGQCHVGINLSQSMQDYEFAGDVPFHNIGLYNLGGTGAYPPDDPGLDSGRFRVPHLRNVAVTAPYMHDGSVATLEEVVDLYARGGREVRDGPLAGDGRASPFKSAALRGFVLLPAEKADLIAFLHALTDRRFLADPRFASPWTEGAR